MELARLRRDCFDILVIDDEPEIRNLLGETFSEQGYRIMTADCLSEARSILYRETFKVVLSDNHLPDGKGLDFLTELPSTGIDSVPILMTGFVDINVAMEAINRGRVFRFVTKPLDLLFLRETVRRAIEHYARLRETELLTREVVEYNAHLRKQHKFQERSLRVAADRIRSEQQMVEKQKHKIEELYSEIQKAYLQTVTALTAAIEAKDRYTKGHSDRVYYYCSLMAEVLGLPESSRNDLRIASVLHDVGKIGVPDSILNKKGALTDQEYELIQSHSVISENILRPLPFLNNVKKIIREHHERYDGTGYPDGLRGDEISLEGRILTVADAYDAMRSDRSYRRALTQKEAMKRLRMGMKTQFCPICVKAFQFALERHGEIPVDKSLSRVAAETRLILMPEDVEPAPGLPERKVLQ